VSAIRLLSILGADPLRWAQRFGIEAFAAPCSECGRSLETTVPCANSTLRGLRAPRCVCGNERTPYCVVRDPRFGDLFSGAL
jgi:hypothetical protein